MGPFVKIRLYYSDHYKIPLPAGHKFPAAKYAMVRDRLAGDARFDLQAAPLADVAELEASHDAGYVRAILDGKVDPRIMRRIGFPWSPELVRRSLASVGGTLAAARHAIRAGMSGNLAGGTHHAFRSEGAGFCVFNDLAIAILVLRREGLARRAAVIDLDVHQGDGTASIFQSDQDVLTCSVHGENNFPFRKQRSAVDIALPDGTGDAEYLDCVREVLAQVIAFRPHIVLYQSGVDALQGDRLGRLALTAAGLQMRDRLVFETVLGRTIPVVITMGGGYGEPIERTVEAHAQCYQIAADIGTFANIPRSQDQ
ncbi:MAG TPA: histone deacetylase [Candidatus Solibacter sp.]|nr:histone deacetylase [Candidatus Solibacter sp.]